MIIGTGQSSGMGDILLLTSICKYIPSCTIELLPSCNKFERFFRNQCLDICYTDTPYDLPNIGDDHYAKCKMRSIGLNNMCYLPHIEISEEEIIRGKELISKFRNPVVFVANTSSKFKSVREVSKDFWNPILYRLQESHDILQFGLSSNFTEFSQTISMLDCSIDDLICYYSAIKNYYGVETGDKHLMLACGGSVNIARSKKYKDHHRWIYSSNKENTIDFE